MDTNLYITEPDTLGESKEFEKINQTQNGSKIKLEQDSSIFGANVNPTR